jgi:hypothetical protein
MKSLTNDEVLELTWQFMEEAHAGRHGAVFMNPAEQRWLTYLARQGLVEVSDAGVGLGIAALTVKGDRLLAEFNTLKRWKSHVGPFILRGEDIAYTAIDGQRWYRVVWRFITKLWFWLLRRVGLD